MKKYVVSSITTFCEDNLLFETFIGLDDIPGGMPLHYSAWGETAQESAERAERLAVILNAGK